MKNLEFQWLTLKIDETATKIRWHAFAVDSPPKVRLEDRSLFMDPSATHDTLQFYCTMLGYEQSRILVAYIEN